MESISELRTICQSSKIEMRGKLGVTYTDLLKRFFLKISIYFTWIFIRFNVGANEVTILSGIFCIIGAFLVASKSIWFVILGIICFHFYTLLDYCDGEVARYNKTGSITGFFLDWYMHFVRDASVFMGLAFGAFNFKFNIPMVLFGFFSVLTPILNKTILNSGWTVICWSRLDEIVSGKIDFNDSIKPISTINKNAHFDTSDALKGHDKKSVNNLFKLVKVFALSIFGHLYSAQILLSLAIMQVFLNAYFWNSLDFRPFLIVYCGIIGPIMIVIRVRSLVKRKAIERGYTRLFSKESQGSGYSF